MYTKFRELFALRLQVYFGAHRVVDSIPTIVISVDSSG
jgi:hypothetical protein